MGAEAGTREIPCKTQFLYENGGMMCTSASCCLGVLVLGKRMSPAASKPEDVQKGVEEALSLADRVQQKVERRMGKTHNAPISVADLLVYGDVTLAKAGVAMEEFIVHESAKNDKVQYEEHAPEKGEPWTLRTLNPASCIVWWNDVVRCMHNEKTPGDPVVAIITAMGHSVVLCNENGIFSLYNSADGVFHTGFTGMRMCKALVDSFHKDSQRAPDFQIDVTLLYRNRSEDRGV